MRKQAIFHALAAAGLLIVGACSDVPNPSEPTVAPASAIAEQEQGADVDVAALARTIPGFGGYFLDRGVPTIYLKEGREQATAERALGLASGELRVLRADYDFNELSQWFDRMSKEALALPGVAFVDLDESTNRVLVGVERGATGVAATAPAGVLAAASRVGVPSAAVVVRSVDPIVQTLTLRQRTRPVRGGFQINFPGFLCTLGFNATVGGVRSWITNSHCTTVQGGVEGTQYWQHSQAGGANNFIGTEVADPAYFVGGVCPPGRQCRRSDSSRGVYVAAATSSLAKIGRTNSVNTGSLTIGSPANFTITAENTSSNFTVGTVLNKVGRTTGWSQGPVTNTCVNTNVSGTIITQLCQTFVSALVGSGDSGSPVFQITSGTNVRLSGILWGGSGSSLFVFSPLGQVEQELGALKTF